MKEVVAGLGDPACHGPDLRGVALSHEDVECGDDTEGVTDHARDAAGQWNPVKVPQLGLRNQPVDFDVGKTADGSHGYA